LQDGLAKLHNAPMSHWDDIKYFLAFVRTGSMAAAAIKLGVNQTTVQRRLARLVQAMLGSRPYEGTQQGPMGPFPTSGRKVRFDFGAVFRIGGVKIKEWWVTWDNMLTHPLIYVGHKRIGRPLRRFRKESCDRHR
jgi:hypothetical protein